MSLDFVGFAKLKWTCLLTKSEIDEANDRAANAWDQDMGIFRLDLLDPGRLMKSGHFL